MKFWLDSHLNDVTVCTTYIFYEYLDTPRPANCTDPQTDLFVGYVGPHV